MEEITVGYCIVDGKVKPIYSEKHKIELRWRSDKIYHTYNFSKYLASKEKNPLKKLKYWLVEKYAKKLLSELFSQEEPTSYEYEFREKHLARIKNARIEREISGFQHTIRLNMETDLPSVELEDKDVVMGITYVRKELPITPRTCFVPCEFQFNGNLYAGYEIKGYTPTSDISHSPHEHSDQPLMISGGMLSDVAVSAFDKCKLTNENGKNDPLALVAVSLPLTVFDMLETFYLSPEDSLGINFALKKEFESVSDYKIPLGIFVRGRQTNLNLDTIEIIYDDFIKSCGLSPAEHFELFIKNFTNDLFALRKNDMIPAELHSRNVSALGTIKDEEEFKSKNSREENFEVTLMSVIEYSLQNIQKIGNMSSINNPEKLFYKELTGLLGERIDTSLDFFNQFKYFKSYRKTKV